MKEGMGHILLSAKVHVSPSGWETNYSRKTDRLSCQLLSLQLHVLFTVTKLPRSGFSGGAAPQFFDQSVDPFLYITNLYPLYILNTRPCLYLVPGQTTEVPKENCH